MSNCHVECAVSVFCHGAEVEATAPQLVVHGFMPPCAFFNGGGYISGLNTTWSERRKMWKQHWPPT